MLAHKLPKPNLVAAIQAAEMESIPTEATKSQNCVHTYALVGEGQGGGYPGSGLPTLALSHKRGRRPGGRPRRRAIQAIPYQPSRGVPRPCVVRSRANNDRAIARELGAPARAVEREPLTAESAGTVRRRSGSVEPASRRIPRGRFRWT